MARAKVVNSIDGVEVIFKGDPKFPEPSLGVIKFPGGLVEVSRCSDNTYWVHVNVDECENIVDSRIDYEFEPDVDYGIPPIPFDAKIRKIAIRVDGVYREND